MIELEATYNPKQYEDKWYKTWQDKGLFSAKVDSDKKPFTILMPPPNVTSQLHMGHGLGYTIQDLLTRWNRMKGLNACWLPGTDHAGIATQMMVEKDLEKEGKTKNDLGRERFVERLHAWKEKYGGIILDQFKSMGFSCDWSRLAYTMDPQLSEAVRHVFVELYQEGLIYRGERLVNWDTVLKTAISDDEVESKEVNGHLWYFRYPIEGTKEFIPIATTRPETMLGDTAVAVNPDDERFKHLIGKQVRLPFTNRLIPVVGDDYVKSEFGTGAVKITPAHDPNDFEIGKRHNLPFISVMNDDGTMADNCPDSFVGVDRFVARKQVIKGLKDLDLFDEEKPYKHAVPHSERSKTVIEPKLSLQWYVRMQELAKPAADVARSGELRFYPDSLKKTYLHWLDNIQDWCISRQLWWGHRIPIWYCNDCEGVSTGIEDPTNCDHCESKNIRQDEDVLDTWFSSWLWPLSPFGWPSDDEQNEDLEYFNPTDVLVTAPEIIFLWVARMVMVNLKFKQRLPFKSIYFNATVCDKKGRKFSKTLGNGIDPLEVIEKHGADAVRYTAISLAPLGGRVRMDVSDFENGARFINKIWNAARFLLQNVDESRPIKPLNELELTLPDTWLISALKDTANEVNRCLESYRVNDAVEHVYHYIWGSFCDWGLECAKEAMTGDDQDAKDRVISVLVYALDGCLRLAHPVMPFVTEELWQKLPQHPDWDRPESIVVANFPSFEAEKNPTDADNWAKVQDIITKVRSARQQSEISPKETLELYISTQDPDLKDVIERGSPWICRLANVSKVVTEANLKKPQQSLTQAGPGYELFVPVEGLLDVSKEIARLETEAKRLTKVLTGLEKKLGNENFVKRAPEDVIQQTTSQKDNLAAQLDVIEKNLEALK
ncbi:valine--tRNA ligase [Pseudobacteriovorax antillogorgiicola]|uniref:Valine--tRNA ligase n=1 Tax=Pseudobacteriovorax antillogorgiicola TaxID=1513793 RepID=A0A1Y6BAJ1_9BACT|nr:valine--tRNA ligase [Pseudobacteriovorax antillogorgiicola]TCS59218.1 valyl-tRNA synthetase [Pseudobacteriovorax antillogorgiicola]SME90398.1 valyl-tRNA synthetase [Pseudobacteriovorax antillogorgiicola]